jgi:hypothetical protein
MYDDQHLEVMKKGEIFELRTNEYEEVCTFVWGEDI